MRIYHLRGRYNFLAAVCFLCCTTFAAESCVSLLHMPRIRSFCMNMSHLFSIFMIHSELMNGCMLSHFVFSVSSISKVPKLDRFDGS